MHTTKSKQRKELQLKSVPVGENWENESNPDGISTVSRGSSRNDKNNFIYYLTNTPRKSSCSKHSEVCSPFLTVRNSNPASWHNESVDALIRRTTHRYGCNDTAETGIYSPELTDFYRMLMRESSEIPVPTKASRRVEINDYDHTKVTEKNYVFNDFCNEANITKFERDEIHFPNVYGRYFSCENCKKAYVSDKFTQRYIKRNKREPSCAFIMQEPLTKHQHFCDVLGKRYCSSCAEKENRVFSRSLEQRLPILTHIYHKEHPVSSRKNRKKINVDMRFVSQSKFS